MLVAAGFPSGQTPLETKLAEIKLAVEYGAREIDIVISRSLVLTGQWEGKEKKSSHGKEPKPFSMHLLGLSLSLPQIPPSILGEFGLSLQSNLNKIS